MKRFGDKLTINALALVVGTVSTNLLGLLFWGVAAHIYDHAAVGRAFAELSALMLLATLSQLNLTNILVRFLPAAGRFTARFVRRGYLSVVAVALVVAFVFTVSGLSGSVIGHDVFDRVLFIVSVALFSLFALQDSVMTALRVTHWVPVENVACAIAKLLLLPVLVVATARTGIIISWMIPIAVSIVVVNGLLFRRAIASATRSDSGYVPSPRRLASFVAAEYLANIAGILATLAIPLIVISKLGATANAYFAIPWLACAGISAVMWNVGVSFLVETLTAPEDSARLLRRSMQLWGLVVAAAVIGCVAVGPLVLPLVGHAYAARGTTLLRLIGFAAPLQLIRVLYEAFTWLDQRVWLLLAIEVVTTAAFLALSLALIPSLGITGIGWSYLITQGVAALLMAGPVWTRIMRLRLGQNPVVLDGAH